jgi:hypothetical protein
MFDIRPYSPLARRSGTRGNPGQNLLETHASRVTLPRIQQPRTSPRAGSQGANQVSTSGFNINSDPGSLGPGNSGPGNSGLGSLDPATTARLQLEAVAKACASWFLWVAGCSMVNSALSAGGAGIQFIFGLGITSIVDAFAHQAGTASIVLTFIVNAFIAGVFLLFWYFAKQGHQWAFLVGMALYVIDGLILLPFHDYLGAAFHLYVLYRLWQGYSTLSRFQSAQQARMAAILPR